MNGPTIDECLDRTGASAIEQLEAHLQRRLNGRVRDLRLVVCGQGLILQGRASTYYVKQLAQHAVMNATALPIVTNEIEVLEQAGSPKGSVR